MADTQNTRINETLAEVIKPANIRKLARFSKATGYSLSRSSTGLSNSGSKSKLPSTWSMQKRTA